MGVRHKTASIPNNQCKMRYTFHRMRTVALGQILALVRDNGERGLENLRAVILQLEPAFSDPNRVATANHKMLTIEQKNRGFSEYYAEFEVIASDLDCIHSDHRNALRIGSSEKERTVSSIGICWGSFLGF